ncbi:MAG: sigma-70 family RNA polymerase sigma factor [Patescibacteria group bacterium]|jgi:RNA polymerase sigma-70 factor (ECF subfamily)
MTNNNFSPLADHNEESDESLVRLTLESQANFAYLIRRYKDKLFYYIKRISGFPEEEIEDILQDVFLKVYKNLNSFNDDSKFSSWIYGIAHNETISAYRKKRSRPQKTDLEVDDDGVEKISSGFDLEKEISDKMTGEEIVATLQEMEDKYREIIVLKFFEGLDYKEISDVIKKPMGTVASLMNRAKKEFKKKFDQNKL